MHAVLKSRCSFGPILIAHQQPGALAGAAGDADRAVGPARGGSGNDLRPSWGPVPMAPGPGRCLHPPGRRRWRRPARSAARGPRPCTRCGSRRAGCRGRWRPTGRVPAGRRPTRPATGISSAAVAPVAAPARPVGPGAHGLVDGRLGHHPYGPGHVHRAVVESRHRGAVARDLVYLAHMRLSPFHGS